MTVVHGTSLHCYDARVNSDKYYRAFIWTDGRTWFSNYHWGRDGKIGMVKAKPDLHVSRDFAEQAIGKKIASKIAEGYVHLGTGEIDTVFDPVVDGQQVGEILHRRVGRDPLKFPVGFNFLIKEVGVATDLVG